MGQQEITRGRFGWVLGGGGTDGIGGQRLSWATTVAFCRRISRLCAVGSAGYDYTITLGYVCVCVCDRPCARTAHSSVKCARKSIDCGGPYIHAYIPFVSARP